MIGGWLQESFDIDPNKHRFLTFSLIFIFFIYLLSCSFACCLLRQGMKQIVISSETPEIKALKKVGDNSAVAAVKPNFMCCNAFFFFFYYFLGVN